jgi:hypothetical protein
MKRRTTGLLLAGLAAGLAACCAASAVALGWRIPGQAAARPLSEHETATLTAAHASYFSPTRLTEITGAAIEVTDTITAGASPWLPGHRRLGRAQIRVRHDQPSAARADVPHGRLRPQDRRADQLLRREH